LTILRGGGCSQACPFGVGCQWVGEIFLRIFQQRVAFFFGAQRNVGQIKAQGERGEEVVGLSETEGGAPVPDGAPAGAGAAAGGPPGPPHERQRLLCSPIPNGASPVFGHRAKKCKCIFLHFFVSIFFAFCAFFCTVCLFLRGFRIFSRSVSKLRVLFLKGGSGGPETVRRHALVSQFFQGRDALVRQVHLSLSLELQNYAPAPGTPFVLMRFKP